MSENEIESLVEQRATAIAHQIVGRWFGTLLWSAIALFLGFMGTVWYIGQEMASLRTTLANLQETMNESLPAQSGRISKLEDWRYEKASPLLARHEWTAQDHEKRIVWSETEIPKLRRRP